MHTSSDALAEMKLRDKERELEALREEKRKMESGASKMEARVKDLQIQLEDARQLADERQAAAGSGGGEERTGGSEDGGREAELQGMLEQKERELAGMRAQLAAAGISISEEALESSSHAALDTSASSYSSRSSRSSRTKGAQARPANIEQSRIPRIASGVGCSRPATAAGTSGPSITSSARKRAPPVTSAWALGNDDAESLQSPAKVTSERGAVLFDARDSRLCHVHVQPSLRWICLGANA
jgi:hypothetical protein